MTVLTVTITDPPAFDKKSSEAQYLSRVLQNVIQKLQGSQGTLTGTQNVLGTSAAGVPNTVVASFTYTATGSIP